MTALNAIWRGAHLRENCKVVAALLLAIGYSGDLDDDTDI